MQRAARRGQGVDAAGNRRVFDQRRGVVRLAPGVDHQRPAAAPVLRRRKRLDPVDVRRRVAPRERRPEEIVQRPGGELAVVDHHHQREID